MNQPPCSPFATACPAASAHERAAAFYGIPSIGTGFLAGSRINAGTITWEQFFPDGCHQRPLGYEIDQMSCSRESVVRAAVGVIMAPLPGSGGPLGLPNPEVGHCANG